MKRRGFLRVIIGAPAAVAMPSLAAAPSTAEDDLMMQLGLAARDRRFGIDAQKWIDQYKDEDLPALVLQQTEDRMALINRMRAEGMLPDHDSLAPYDYEEDEE